jgi:hypothetical protein
MTHPAASIGPIPLPAIFGMRKHGICQPLLTYTDFAKSCRLALNACGEPLGVAGPRLFDLRGAISFRLFRSLCGLPRIRAAPHPLQLSSGDG